LGVSIYSVTPDIAHSLGLSSAMGALVSQVVDGSPAGKAGIRAGDVITTINGQNVKSNSELRNTIGLLRVGDKVDIGLVRDGKPMRVTAVIADNAAELAGGPASIHKAFEGATLVDAPDASGALVRSIEPGSAAAQAGLRAVDTVGLSVANVHEPRVLSQLFAGCDAVVNLIGILNPRRGASFDIVHTELAAKVMAAARTAAVRRVLHMSALGADAQAPSRYLRSKAAAEARLRAPPHSEATRAEPGVTSFRP